MRRAEGRPTVAGIMGAMDPGDATTDATTDTTTDTTPDTTPDATTDGALIVRADVVGTAIVVVAGVLGALSSGLAKSVVAPVSAVAGAVGIATFVWSYFHAIGRSREHEISVSQLYGVVGTVAPKSVKRSLQRALLAQIVVAIAVMAFGFSRTKPEQFNWAAVIIVVPMFGMGMNGVWVSRHGTFGPRILTARPTRRCRRPARPATPSGAVTHPTRPVRPMTPKNVPESHDSTVGMQQNEPHG